MTVHAASKDYLHEPIMLNRITEGNCIAEFTDEGEILTVTHPHVNGRVAVYYSWDIFFKSIAEHITKNWLYIGNSIYEQTGGTT